MTMNTSKIHRTGHLDPKSIGRNGPVLQKAFPCYDVITNDSDSALQES